MDRPASSTKTSSTKTGRNWHQNSGKFGPSRWGSLTPQKRLRTRNNNLRGPLSPQSACFPLALRLSGAKWDDFGPDQPGPKTAQNHHQRGPTALRPAPAGFSVPLREHNPLGQHVGYLFVIVCRRFCPSNGVGWPNLGPFALMASVMASETKNWLYLGLDGQNRDSEGTFPPCQPPPLVVSTLQNSPNAPPGACLAVFWALLVRACPLKRGSKNGSKNGSKAMFSIKKLVALDHLGCL